MKFQSVCFIAIMQSAVVFCHVPKVQKIRRRSLTSYDKMKSTDYTYATSPTTVQSKKSYDKKVIAQDDQMDDKRSDKKIDKKIDKDSEKKPDMKPDMKSSITDDKTIHKSNDKTNDKNKLYINRKDDEKKDLRIVGGITIKGPNEYPYVGVPAGATNCVASLFHDDLMLTAAYCADAFESGVYLGGTKIDGSESQLVLVEKAIIHPEFSSTTHANDIMILKLSQPVSSLPQVKLNLYDATLPAVNEGLEILGYGATSALQSYSSTLQRVRVITAPVDRCSMYRWYTAEKNVCSWFPDGGRDSCSGDAGGPVLLKGTSTQVAIVSFGDGCGEKTRPTVNTRISAYADFIKTAICEESAVPSLRVSCTMLPKKLSTTSSTSLYPTKLNTTKAPVVFPAASTSILTTASNTTTSTSIYPTALTTAANPILFPTKLSTTSSASLHPSILNTTNPPVDFPATNTSILTTTSNTTTSTSIYPTTLTTAANPILFPTKLNTTTSASILSTKLNTTATYKYTPTSYP